MNTGLGSMSFPGLMGPVNVSKNIGSANPFAGETENINFGEILTGFLSSKEKGEIPEENPSLEMKKDAGIYGTMIENLIILYDSNLSANEELKPVIEGLPENLNEEIEKQIENLLEKIKNPEIFPEEDKNQQSFLKIKNDLTNLLLENKILPAEIVEELFSEGNFKNMNLKEKADFVSSLGRELMGILKDSLEEKVSLTADKIEALKTLVQEDKSQSFEKEKVIPTTTKARELEVKLQEDKPLPLQEQVSDKTALNLPKNFTETLEAITKEPVLEEVPEKVEARELPKFIENQIKNSFKLGENGTKELTVKIHPEHLGKLTLKITTDESSEMTVRIVADSKNIKEYLDTNLSGLRNSLENSGIKNEIFNIEIDFEKGFQQFKDSNQHYQDNSGRKANPVLNEDESFEEQIESIFNNSGQVEVFA